MSLKPTSLTCNINNRVTRDSVQRTPTVADDDDGSYRVTIRTARAPQCTCSVDLSAPINKRSVGCALRARSAPCSISNASCSSPTKRAGEMPSAGRAREPRGGGIGGDGWTHGGYPSVNSTLRSLICSVRRCRPTLSSDIVRCDAPP